MALQHRIKSIKEGIVLLKPTLSTVDTHLES